MKKCLAGLLAMLLLAVFTLPVTAYDGIEARLNRQQGRLDRLASTGEISPREQQRLQQELNHIRERVSRDPYLNREERRRLEGRMDRLDEDIDQAKRRHRERPPAIPFVPPPR